MRLAVFVLGPLLVCLFLTDAACNAGPAGPQECGCPDIIISPLVMILLPCGTATPVLALSGVCAGTGGEQSGQLTFGSTGAGTCHVELTYADGTTYTTDVEFTGQWRACGSDPNGCGEQFAPVGLPTEPGGYLDVLSVGDACVDGGNGDAHSMDGATE
jgi:hypothetical protein